MQDAVQPLCQLFAWYDGVVNELQQAKDRIKHLNDTLEKSTHGKNTIEDLKKQLELSRKVSNGFEHRVRELENNNSKQERTLEYFMGVAAEAIAAKIQLKGTAHKLDAAQVKIQDLEKENERLQIGKDSIVNSLKMAENATDFVCEHKLSIAQARIRVLEQERDETLDELEDYRKGWYNANNYQR